MKAHFLIIVSQLIFLGCSQRLQDAKIPTLQEIQPYIQQRSGSVEELQSIPASYQNIIAYRWAKDNESKNQQSKACELYTWLGQQDDFISPHHVHIGTLKNCLLSPAEKNFKIQQMLNSTDSHWVREDFLRASSEIIQSGTDLYAQILFHLTDFETNQEAKISNLQSALTSATLQETRNLIQLKLEEVAPRFILSPRDDQLFIVARDLERARDFTKAREYYQILIKNPTSPFEEKLKALDRIALTFKVQRSQEIYLRELINIENQFKQIPTATAQELQLKNKYLIDHMITRARAIWTANNREAGRTVLELALSSNLADSNQMAQIYFVLGAMEIEKNSTTNAQDFFKKGISYNTTDNRIAELLHWSLGWSYYLAKDFKQAAESFSSAAKAITGQAFASKVMFWEAQAYLNMNKNSHANKIFNQIIKNDPYSYYAILSKHVTNKSFQPLNRKNISNNYDQTFSWLILLGEKKSAKARLESLLANNSLDHSSLIQAYYQGELYKEAIFHFGRNSSQLKPQEQLKLLPFIYPLAHLSTFELFANKYSIPIELPLSITRQESAFDPDARSWADAFGLMQLIPERANQLARELDLKIEHFSDLYEPSLNIQLGTYLLSKLYKQYKGEFPFNIASYNAGERPVNNWRTNRFRGDVLEFIESIPYQETQNYVKLILRNKVIYRKLMSEKSFQLKDLDITNF